MTSPSRLSLVIQLSVAMLVLLAVMFPTVIAQHWGPLWLQGVGTCVLVVCVVVLVRAMILLKRSREPDTPLIKKLWRASAFAYALVLSCGFGTLALRAQTWHAWLIWAAFSAPLVSLLYHELRERV